MLSLTNTRLLWIEKKVFDPRCCLCNKHQRWERSQYGPVETREEEEEAEEVEGRLDADTNVWLKNDKQHETGASQARVYNLIFLRHFNRIFPVTSDAIGWAQRYMLRNSLIPDEQIRPAFFYFLPSYLSRSGRRWRSLGHGDETLKLQAVC